MDIRLDGLYVEALLRLQKLNGLKYPVAMIRELIREAAKDAGVWPSPDELTENIQHDSTEGEE